MFVGLSVFLSNEVQPGQKGYWNGFKVAQSLSALSPGKQGGRLACCRADKVFLMALRCIIYFKKLAFVLSSEKQFEKKRVPPNAHFY